MKHISKYLVILISIYACQNEIDLTNVSENTNTIRVELHDITNNAKHSYGPLIQLQVEYGRLECDRQFTNCDCVETDLNTFCKWQVNFRELPPLDFEEPPMVWNPCNIIPCGWDYTDPWGFYENTNSQKFGSLKDYFELEIEQPKAEGYITIINDELLMVQFYKENQMMGEPSPQPSVYYLNNEIMFDKDVAKKIGLGGTVIESGKYPIIYNKENHTFNVVFKVH